MTFDTDPRDPRDNKLSGRFPLGRLVGTPGAIERMKQYNIKPEDLIRRHASGDWGDVDPHDARENEFAVDHGLRLMSSYGTGDECLWVITEADRSVTTILRPEDY